MSEIVAEGVRRSSGIDYVKRVHPEQQHEAKEQQEAKEEERRPIHQPTQSIQEQESCVTHEEPNKKKQIPERIGPIHPSIS